MTQWPQWVYLTLVFLTLISHAIQHGKPRGEYDVRNTIIDSIVAIWLLWCGGFWKGIW